ncbi:unnamed protein product [Cylicocyclus nassatus]|uniref:Uncharacterized protein n=1 Tax=Cylicocyclus nassatus TaxID=53992 RepID=A0AA36H7H3_CYLNA|nr:unnamed protein product [Cylicocyclus nassatus]
MRLQHIDANVMYTVMCYSQVFICASLAVISCHKRRAEVSEKTEVTAKGASSASEIVEVTAKSNRADWNNAQDTHPSVTSDKSKETQISKPNLGKATSDQQASSSEPKKAEISADVKLPPVGSSDSAHKQAETPKDSALKKDDIKSKEGKKHVFVLETLSFLKTERKDADDKKAEDETVNDAPSLTKINISKASEEMISIQTKKETPKGAQFPKPKEGFDDSKLYALQRTMASHSDGTLKQLAVKKTPYPSAEL